MIAVPDTGTTEYFEQQHHVSYIPDPGPVYGRTQNVIFNAAGEIDCLDEDTRFQSYYLTVRGYTESGDVMIVVLLVVNNLEYWTETVGYIGCSDVENSESEWLSEDGTIPTTDSFEDDWGKTYYRYTKTILNDRSGAVALPEAMGSVRAVVVSMLLSLEGGLNPQPDTMPAATLSVDLIGLS